jgi:hypothetical protein
MQLTGLLEHIGEEHIFRTVDAAVQAFEARPAAETPPAVDAADPVA